MLTAAWFARGWRGPVLSAWRIAVIARLPWLTTKLFRLTSGLPGLAAWSLRLAALTVGLLALAARFSATQLLLEPLEAGGHGAGRQHCANG